MKRINVKYIDSQHNISVIWGCSHKNTKVQYVELDGFSDDEWLICKNCDVVLESLNDLKRSDWAMDYYDELK